MKKGMTALLAAACLTLASIPVGLTAGSEKAFACSKGETTTPEYDYSVSSHVLYGMVSKLEKVYYKGQLYKMATLINDSQLKGSFTRTVLTAADSDQCGASLVVGRDYLFYADNRLGRPAVSVFDVFEGEVAAGRVAALKNMDRVPEPEPGVHTVTLYPGSNVKLTLDGSTVPVTATPLFFKDSLYVPMTFFRDILGYVTVWNSDPNRFEILLRSEWAGIAAQGNPSQSEFKDSVSGIPVGSEPFEANVSYSNVQVKVDGKLYAPEGQPFSYRDVVYVPLRDTSEKLGIQVNWDPATYTAQLKDGRPIDPLEHPALIMKLSSSREGEHDIIIDRFENDKAVYHYDEEVPYGQTMTQWTAELSDVLKQTGGIGDRSIRLFLSKGEREYELIITEGLRNALLSDPAVRKSISYTLGKDLYNWPEDGVIGMLHIRS